VTTLLWLAGMAGQAAAYSPGEVGTVGHATLYASYKGVRSDSVQFFFPAACKDQDHLYHGSQVNNQVPPS
jgi:hypothetical protein